MALLNICLSALNSYPCHSAGRRLQLERLSLLKEENMERLRLALIYRANIMGTGTVRPCSSNAFRQPRILQSEHFTSTNIGPYQISQDGHADDFITCRVSRSVFGPPPPSFTHSLSLFLSLLSLPSFAPLRIIRIRDPSYAVAGRRIWLEPS